MTTVVLNTLDDSIKKIKDKTSVISNTISQSDAASSQVTSLKDELTAINVTVMASELKIANIKEAPNMPADIVYAASKLNISGVD